MPPAEPQEQEDEQHFPLLALPQPLLLVVLQCLAADNDQRSLFSAARAHSRLRQAAAVALGSITAQGLKDPQRLDSVLLYLGKHGQHINSVGLVGFGRLLPQLCQLPPNLRLHSLHLSGQTASDLHVQLLPGDGFQGVLGYDGVSALKQLRLHCCELLDGNKGLAAALAQLSCGLQHLSIAHVRHYVIHCNCALLVTFPMGLLEQGLQQLTHLELKGTYFSNEDQPNPILQPLQALSRLADLRLAACGRKQEVLTASMLSAATGLTRLELGWFDLEPGLLAGKTQLQHLGLIDCATPGDATWTAMLLPQLASLLQLTHLKKTGKSAAPAPAAAYSALTASSKLRHLDISYCTLPAGAWQHVFPAGRQLPHLTSLEAAYVHQHGRPATGNYIVFPEGSHLVSCCPGLRCLDVSGLEYSAGALSALQGLSALHTLTVSLVGEALREVCQLTGLRELTAFIDKASGELLLQVTQLKQLTRLQCYRPLGHGMPRTWVTQAPDDERVWRQVLQAHLDHSDPAVAQAAAAALAAAE